ncbi:MAG: ABC transporter substrate-binding protein [Deltaproteobacteria bacterium]|nr:ABC transporter substrate-binding protein [Deltaproteobacteria bacterium]
MSKTTCRYIIFLAAYLLVFSNVSLPNENNNIAVVISKKIRPYLNVLEGITDSINQNSNKIEIFFLSDSDKNNKQIHFNLLNGQYDLCVAVGPEAADFIWSVNGNFKYSKIYTAVLAPDAIIKNSPGACGISLRIPVETQIREIAHSFPEIKGMGLLFDPDHNQWFYEKASSAAKTHGIKIIPLYVDSKIQIPKKIKDNWKNIDCIWMIPDRTVISEKIIQYIIKQGIYNNKGVIGYNSFFIRSGAFFAFEFDYRELGIQTGKKIESYLENGICSQEPPLFNKIINYKIVRKIGIRVEEK